MIDASLWIKLQFNFSLISLIFLSGISYYLLRIHTLVAPRFIYQLCNVVINQAHILSALLFLIILIDLFFISSLPVSVMVCILSYVIFDLRMSHLRGTEHQDRANLCFSVRYGIALISILVLLLVGYPLTFKLVICAEILSIYLVCVYCKHQAKLHEISQTPRKLDKMDLRIFAKTIVNGTVALPFVLFPAIASWVLSNAELKAFFVMLQVFNSFLFFTQYLANEVIKNPSLISDRSGSSFPDNYLILVNSSYSRILFIFSLTAACTLGWFYKAVQGVTLDVVPLYTLCLICLSVVIYTKFPILYLLTRDKDVVIVLVMGTVVAAHNLVFFIDDLTAIHVFYAMASIFCLVRIVAYRISKIINVGVRK